MSIFSYSQPGYKGKYSYSPKQFSVASGYRASAELDPCLVVEVVVEVIVIIISSSIVVVAVVV